MDLIRVAEAPHLKRKITYFRPGDVVKVHAKVIEGDKERVQIFEGTVIARRGRGTGETFTVRRVSYGIGVERTFLVHSPRVAKIELARQGKVRRAKLFYLRGRGGKETRIEEERQQRAVGGSPPAPVASTEAAPEGQPAPARVS